MPATDDQSIALGKLLLIQHALEVLPNETSIASFLCRSLSTIPGVKDVHVCIRGVVTPDHARFRELCRAWGEQGSSLATPPLTRIFPLRTSHQVYGVLVLSIDHEDQFSLREPYLANTANTVATLLESRDRVHQLNVANELIQRAHDELNIRVRERTAELTFKNAELQQEVRERKAADEQIAFLAYHDALTGLPNRLLLLDRLQQVLDSGAPSRRNGALLFIDLDHFKPLKKTLGHDNGDLLLQQVARRLSTCVRDGDTVARLGGDEFVVMLEGLSEHPETAATQAETVGGKILATLNQPHLITGDEVRSTASIGVTLFGGRQNAAEALLKQADLAMQQSKTAGRNTLRFFDPEMQAIVAERAALEFDLHEAVRQQQFLLYYQPQVVGDGRLTGAEALVRWQHPQRGMVSPAEFIPLATETGLILPLGLWILETACAQLATWAAQPNTEPLTLAVNICASQLHQVDFVDQVLTILGKTGANPHRLKLELTESLLVSHVENTIAKMAALKVHGVGFSLDDFGTGYSSLSYLKRLPLDQLKIDQGFVRDILIDPNDAAIARMVVALAGSMGLAVIAEGVETQAQRVFLAGLGCHAYQGYLFSRPLPLDEFEAFVKRL